MKNSRNNLLPILCALLMSSLLLLGNGTTQGGTITPPSLQAVVLQEQTANLIPLQNIKQIAAGNAHTCVLTMENAVKCWGHNLVGQLGSGTYTDSAIAIDVRGLGSGVTAISVGEHHTCALMNIGRVKCWGGNWAGQLGNNDTSNSNMLVDVAGLDGDVRAIGAGGSHTCVLMTSGAVKCWGRNYQGQLGNGTQTDSQIPVDVIGLSSGIIAISAGQRHTCALTDAGSVKCWGDNFFYGQLGDGTGKNSSIPVDVSGLGGGVTAISAGQEHTCALLQNGTVKCWGSNHVGQLGDPVFYSGKTPVDVTGIASVTAISAGRVHTCAVIATGAAKCWGANSKGQLGNGTATRQGNNTPGDVIGLSSGVIAIGAGEVHTCAVITDNTVKCWGGNWDGQLGNGTIGNSSVPTDVSGLSSGVTAISVELDHTCSLTTSGSVKCWGSNWIGKLGNGNYDDSSIPVDVIGLNSRVTAISAGEGHTCALTTSDGVKCWGVLSSNSSTTTYVPVDIGGLDDGVTAISAGGGATCALTLAGGVKCWGQNGDGQLGNGTTTDSTTAVDVIGLSSGVIGIGVGREHTCALTSARAVKCWGDNSRGQLGNGTTTSSLSPVDVSELSGVTAISTGAYHTCVLTTTGAVKCWGDNAKGPQQDSSIPVDVSGLNSDVEVINAGTDYTCALTTEGGVKCWGYNVGGVLGNGTTSGYFTPTDVSGLTSGSAAISAGWNHTCALTTSGAVKCWGRNDTGQLGNGKAWQTTPGVVLTEDNDAPIITPTPTTTPPINDTNAQIEAFLPNQMNSLSTIMLGGTAVRYLKVKHGDNLPLAGATVTLSTGDTGISDASGVVSFIVSTSRFNNTIGTYNLQVQSVRVTDTNYALATVVTFPLKITARSVDHDWSYGIMQSVKGGSDTGLIAMIGVKANRGAKLQLTDTNPSSTPKVELQERLTGEVNAELGLGVDKQVASVANLEAKAAINSAIRGFAEVRSTFDNPFSDEQRKSQGVLLTTTFIDSLGVTPALQPLIAQVLFTAKQRVPYLDAIDQISNGYGVKFEAGVAAGAGIDTTLTVGGATQKLKLTLADVSGIMAVAMRFTDSKQANGEFETSKSLENSTEFNIQLLHQQLSALGDDPLANKLLGWLGQKAGKLKRESFYDKATGQFKRYEVTLTAEGNSGFLFNPSRKSVAIKFTTTNRTLISQIENLVTGNFSAMKDLAYLLTTAQGIMSYEVTVEDGTSVAVPELSLGEGIKLELGLQTEQNRSWVYERGALVDGRLYKLESYADDSYLPQPSHTWQQLANNALGGLWLLAGDVFNVITQTINATGDWVVSVLSNVGNGILQGGARLFGFGISASDIAMSETATTITAAGWLPYASASSTADGVQSTSLHNVNLQTVLGNGFVVGGIYSFQPYSLTVQSATLVLTHTVSAAMGLDTSKIELYRWQANDNNWEPLTAETDLNSHTYTTTISQLGTFALGYDITPPSVSFDLTSTVGLTTPQASVIRAFITDLGSGVAPGTIEVLLDGVPVTASYMIATGELIFIPSGLTDNSNHQITIHVQDTTGNETTKTQEVLVHYWQDIQFVYLPVVQK